MLDLDLLFSSQFYLIKRLLRRDFKEIEPLLSGSVLDVGCGRRPFEPFIIGSGKKYIGMEYSPFLKPDFVGDSMNLPIRTESVDSVISTQVLEHVPEPEKAIKEAYRVLRKGGVFYLTVPMMHYLHYEPHDYFRFTQYGIRHLLEKCGFSVNRCKPVGTLVTYVLGIFVEFLVRTVAHFTIPLRPWPNLRWKTIIIPLVPIQLCFCCIDNILTLNKKRTKSVMNYNILAVKK